MKPNTCEQYVLQQLENAETRVEELGKALDEARNEISQLTQYIQILEEENNKLSSEVTVNDLC
jgi:prefoldin subunit 5